MPFTQNNLATALAKNPQLAQANPALLPLQAPTPSKSPTNPTSLDRVSSRLERLEQATFRNWLLLNNLHFIHASPRRRVHDLPPGWPDFSLFKTPFLSSLNRSADCLFIELKSSAGSLSPSQSAHLSAFPNTKIALSAADAIALARSFFHLP